MYFGTEINKISGINDMSAYIFLKGFIQFLFMRYFANSISLIYGNRIAFFTFAILLLDPYLFSLKLTILRDDLICASGLLLVGSTIRIKELIFKKIFSFDYIFFIIALD